MSKVQLAIAACLATAATAFESISVPTDITAGEDFTLTVTTNNSDSAYTSYRVYLDTTPPGYTGGPSCYLYNTTSTNTTTLQLNIPPAFGPDGTFYSIATKEFPSATGYTLSNSFNLTGATGNWSTYEDSLNGTPLWPADDLPCSSYECARTCAMASYPKDLNYDSSAHTKMSSCIMTCPGVGASDYTTSSTATETSSSGKTTATKSVSTSTTGTATATSDTKASSTSSGAAATGNVASVALIAVGGIFSFLL
ncbi:hypothetical protein BDV97DRAFT_397737 [Delphinella strobiligena]|nr:hypothetical protein BDV97DRAFT_397737 [Delphinella strobiligena]